MWWTHVARRADGRGHVMAGEQFRSDMSCEVGGQVNYGTVPRRQWPRHKLVRGKWTR